MYIYIIPTLAIAWLKLTSKDLASLLTVSAVVNGCCLSIESDVQSFGQLDWELVVAFSTAEVRAGELKVVILVPVFEREL